MVKKYTVVLSEWLQAWTKQNPEICEVCQHIQMLVPQILFWSQHAVAGKLTLSTDDPIANSIQGILFSQGIGDTFPKVHRMTVFLSGFGHAKYFGGFEMRVKMYAGDSKEKELIAVFARFYPNGRLACCATCVT